jgi:regulator of sirC expression with transglutaminase-like and TPR domain
MPAARPIYDLDSLATRDVEAVPWEDIAFAIALEKYPDSDFQPYRERLDEFARRARLRVGRVLGGQAVAQGLSRYLFEEEGFRGNSSDYYNLSNSFLNDVLDTRQGIPITLSILYIAIGRRLGLNLMGVSFPGHFLVRFENDDGTLFVDPYHRGQLLSETGCREKLIEIYGEGVPFRQELLAPAAHREILIRMLANLKVVAIFRQEYTLALQILNRILLFNPEGVNELKERGLVSYQLECFGQALKDLEKYLSKRPGDPDRPKLENYINDLREKVNQMV